MPEELYEYVGHKIRTYRDQHGMTQEELAAAIGVTANTISRWETATYKPTVADLDRLTGTFDLPIWALMPSRVQAPIEQQQALLSATGDLPEEDLEELQRYAHFIRARKRLRQGNRSSGRRPGPQR